ncbi:hypothetical protein [Fodinibius halophilus]|uniref:Lipoprotein n=1 Tax=Fodinibius halophilus TaxID=1736908 RepID=A0A6M1TCI2_9BACT|nr:hypothetical protein [Fodinibius halophilus]NGP90073.1 hypothetical protein [Fodinibius halophilus]
MKYFKHNITSVFLVLLMFALFSCESSSTSEGPQLKELLDEAKTSTGAFLRVASVKSAAFDLADKSTAAYTIKAEYEDGEGNSLLESVEFYVAYESFALDPQQRETIKETKDPFKTVDASAFEEDSESGLPTATISVPLSEAVSALSGLSMSDLGVGDSFELRWKVNLTDGRSFSVDQSSAPVSSGFYRSPFFSRVKTVQKIPADEFTGMYHFEAQGAGVFGWPTFETSFDAQLSVDPENKLNGRVFTAKPYPPGASGFDLAEIQVPIALGPTATPTSEVGTGLGCDAGLAVGPMQNSSQNGVIIDVNDDSQFTLVVGDNVRGDCDASPVDVTYIVTKL